jgi:hypothetical protein
MTIHVDGAAVDIAQINKAFSEMLLKRLAFFDAALGEKAVFGRS